MAAELREEGNEKEIRALIERWAAASRKGDIDGIMACYTPDVVAFDAITALRFRGTDAYRQHWETCLSFVPSGSMIFEAHELEVAAHGDVAFAHYLSRCGCVDAEGQERAGWMRATMCCRRTPSGWRIAHEHHSMPFDPQTNEMLGDLEP